MGECKFVRVYLRRTQEKLEWVLGTEDQSGLIWMANGSRLSSYKRMKVDSKTMWSVEGVMNILRRNASGGRSKFSKGRTFYSVRRIQYAQSGWEWDKPNCMTWMGKAGPGRDE
jgi:hypothetical protein